MTPIRMNLALFKIQSIKSNARGFCSFHNYSTRILFCCGKLAFSRYGTGRPREASGSYWPFSQFQLNEFAY